MSKTKAAARPKTSPAGSDGSGCNRSTEPVDLQRLREIAEIATEFDLAEIELDACGGLHIVRRNATFAAGAPALLPPPPAPVPSAVVADKAARSTEAGTLLTSPFVGTFYRAPAPEAPVFVEVGQTVRKGQVVCIVEAMKLMNEIESEYDGKILEVMAKNAEHVEYGQPLFRIEKA
ncbi:MAG: acetyl-CoA carboxylase biotin carboxyl carrier protein [Polyangia bacterium]|jgi:acetyl-CoA carboxylase biotin carboxyl carrier protein